MVCASCNHGWMARLEADAKPILLSMAAGDPVSLGPEAQRVLAAWALKTAVVHDNAQGKPWRPTPMGAECRHLADTGIPTSNVLVWLSSCLDPPPARARLWGTTATVTTMDGELTAAEAYGATLALGPVWLQMLYTTIPDLPQAFTLEQRPAIALIWPYQQAFDWSERENFTDEGFEDLASALPGVLRSTLRGDLATVA
jgi:hypothetical protein